jgi:hypothetical protein
MTDNNLSTEEKIILEYLRKTPENLKIDLLCKEQEVIISGNREGLFELASHIMYTALKDYDGAHMHLADYDFFDKADKELIIVLNNKNF